MSDIEPKENFMFVSDKTMKKLCDLVDKRGQHSGCSIGETMIIMQKISRIEKNKNEIKIMFPIVFEYIGSDISGLILEYLIMY